MSSNGGGGEEDFLDWEPREATVTAWSAASSAVARGKRRGAYGNSQQRKGLQRSFSLPIPRVPARTHTWTNRTSSESGNSGHFPESLESNELEESSVNDDDLSIELPPKPLRRSHSIPIETPSSSADSFVSSSLSTRGSSEGSFDVGENVDPNWARRKGRKTANLRRSQSQSSSTSTPTRRGHTSPASSTSNRKRSPSGFDFDEDLAAFSSSSTGRRTRSRSLLMTAEELAGVMPYAPNLNMSVGNLSTASVSSYPTPSSCRGAEMEVDSESDSTGGSPDTSVDISSDELPHVYMPRSDGGGKVASEKAEPDFLPFLLEALGKEQTRICESWSVVANQGWTSQRRTAFYAWSKSLGFALKPIGNGGFYTAISKTKGRELLKRLESGSQNLQSMAKWSPVTEPVRVTRPPIIPVSWPDQQTNDLSNGLAAMTVDEVQVLKDENDLVEDSVSPAVQSKISENRDSLEVYNHQDVKLYLHGETPQRPCNQSFVRSSYGSFVVGTPQMDCLAETPLNSACGWGTRPINGRDWGTSCECEKETLETLSNRFEESTKAAGTRDSCDSNFVPLMPSVFPTAEGMEMTPQPSRLASQESVLASPAPPSTEQARTLRKRRQAFAKHNRVSLCVSAIKRPSRQTLWKPLFASTLRESMLRSSILAPDEFLSEKQQQPEEEISSFLGNPEALARVFEFLDESELLCKASLVCTAWADAAATAHADRMLASVQCGEENQKEDVGPSSLARSMEWSWSTLNERFPWGCFLSEGSFKQVFRVHNGAVNACEAVSVMDVGAIVDKRTIAAELTVSALLSSLARRGICPNFIVTRGVFTCSYPPPSANWGSAENKKPKGGSYIEGQIKRAPRQPKHAYPGRYQYIRMELCSQGDAEEYLKRQADHILSPAMSQAFLFQIAFALHAAADRFSLKHYDLKMLNVFVQEIDATTENVVLRYAFGSHTFCLRMKSASAVLAKLADYGTANISAESNGLPVTIAQFTTLENTPPDFMILGDEAHQGHGHDNFGLGLCMLHLFTGNAPYEEILEEVVCPKNLKKRLRAIWEDENLNGFDAIRSVILCDVYKDEAGNIVEGEPDDTLYDTFYRFLVLFGIPERFQVKKCPLVWKAIEEILQTGGSKRKKRAHNDISTYTKDCRKYSIRSGNHKLIAQARETLGRMRGGLELLFSLCCFDPTKRATAMDVLNSTFMEDLREPVGSPIGECENETVFHYGAFATSS